MFKGPLVHLPPAFALFSRSSSAFTPVHLWLCYSIGLEFPSLSFGMVKSLWHFSLDIPHSEKISLTLLPTPPMALWITLPPCSWHCVRPSCVCTCLLYPRPLLRLEVPNLGFNYPCFTRTLYCHDLSCSLSVSSAWLPAIWEQPCWVNDFVIPKTS